MSANEQIRAAYNAEKLRVYEDCTAGKGGVAARTAIVKFYERLDVAIESAIKMSGDTIDCRKGCDYCCHFKVELGAEEVFAIKNYVDSVFSPVQRQVFLEQAHSNHEGVSSLSQTARVQANIPCPFLSAHECTIYAIRPAMCRKLHSLDVQSCKDSFDNPADSTISNAEQPIVSAISLTAISAAREGLSEAKFDATVYDMNEVLVDAFENKKCEKRWSRGKKAFPGCG